MTLSVGAVANGFTIVATACHLKGRRVVWVAQCHSCGVVRLIRKSQVRRSKNCPCRVGKKTKASLKQAPGEAGFNKLLKTYKYNAELRGLEFKLTDSEFKRLTGSPCAYCGTVPSQKACNPRIRQKTREHQTYLYNGVDRVSNEIGYTPDNCVACCGFCNRAKSTRTKDEFMEWILRVVGFNATKGTDI